MADDLPAPLVADEVFLGDFSWMPIQIQRLKSSKAWLRCKRRPELAFYMLNLWTAAWNECPAASLEDDDDVLADRAMCDPKTWRKVRDEVLRGWVLCSDGRLYHPTVAEMAHDAFEKVQSQKHRTEAARRARAMKLSRSQSTAATEPATSNATADVTETATETRRQDKEQTDDSTCSEADASGAGAPAQGAPEPGTDSTGDQNTPQLPGIEPAPAPTPAKATDKEAVFAIGVALLTSAGQKESSARTLLGLKVKQYGEAKVLETLNRCAAEQPIQPVSWLIAALPDRPAATSKPDRLALANAEKAMAFAERMQS